MSLDPTRQEMKPFFGSDHRGLITGFLNILYISSLVVVSLFFLFRQVKMGLVLDVTSIILACLLIIQFFLLALLRRGDLDQTALILVFIAWSGVSYQAWRSAVIWDVMIHVYVLTILTTVFLATSRTYLIISALSGAAIWALAVADVSGLRTAGMDAPVNRVRDLIAIFVLLSLMFFLVFRTLRRTRAGTQAENLERLRAGEERFRKIFHVSPVAISVTSLKDGRLLEANAAYWKLTGFDPDTSIGRTTVELRMWDTEAQRQAFVGKLSQRRSLHNPHYEFFNAAGTASVTIAFYELIDSGDEPSILSMFYDITDQKQAQTALQRSDEHFRKIFHISPIAIVITTLAEGRIINANQAYWKLSGHNPKTSIGRTTFELRVGLQTEQRAGFVRELLEKRSLQNPAYDFVNEQGEHLKTAAFHELIDEAGVPAILSMFYDMTEQNNAREALIQSEARVRALLKATPDMIFELTRDGTVVQFIPSAESDPFLQPDEFIGKTIAQIFPFIAEQTNFAIGRALDSGQVNAFEYQLPSGAEKKDFEARITPAGPDLVLATVRDVSLRKWAESEREKLINELEAKNAELERFTYTVSHDLKSPLITIKGFLGYVQEDVRMGNMTRFETDLRRIDDATDKMQHLLSDLLELSRIGRLTAEPAFIPMNELVAEVLEMLHGRIHANNIAVHVAENLPPVYGDRQRLFEVIQNLIENAAKFMGTQPAPRIEIGVQGELNGNPVFFVRDNGIGIAPQFKDKVFGLFDKLNAQSEGTGIGLALVKRIIEFHKGSIWLESEIGQGVTFYFALPTQPAADEAIK